MIRTMRHLLLAALALALPQGPASAADFHRYTGEGERFDFGIEAVDGVATLYLARKPTNEPHTGDKPVLVPDDESLPSIQFITTAEPGVYAALYGDELPEGQLEVTVDGFKEAVDVYLVENAGGHGHHGHDHSHGTERRSPAEMLGETPLLATGLLGVFLAGVIVGRASRRKKRSEPTPTTVEAYAVETVESESESDVIQKSSAGIALLFLLGSVFAGQDAKASEGHTHDAVEIDSGSAGGEVTITKKSQFLIQLRTQPAKTVPVKETLETLGHLSPKPQLDATVKTPASGFVKLASEQLLGRIVTKGELLGKVEGVGVVELRAPISGTVVELSATSGIRLESGDPILRIVDSSVLWVDAEVFQKDLARLKKASSVAVMVEGMSAPINGRLLGIKSLIDEKTLTAKVYVEVENPDGALPLGAVAHVTFELDTIEGQGMVFPKSAVLNRGGERIVFVQTGPESFLAKPVATRFGSSPGTIVVTKGLEEGDRVVVSGGYQVLVGAK